ncbi:MAG: hypothetical protein LBL52_00790 [Rickettsiales bacterium]|nr:hypothetical protein [Rickettsiales bacterium]
MMNERKSIEHAAAREFAAASTAFSPANFAHTRRISYISMGIEYWKWHDALASLEARFSRDLASTSDKFKIDTVDAAIAALYRAPKLESLYKE